MELNIDGTIGGWWGITASELRRRLPNDRNEPIILNINSRGGDVFEGFAIYQLLQEYTNVTVKIGAFVASAASYAILSASKVIARSTSTVMMHRAWTFTAGNQDEIKKDLARLTGIDAMIAKAYSVKTGKTIPEMDKAMEVTTWLFGAEAIRDFGIADEIEIVDGESTELDSDSARNSVEVAIKSFKNEYTRMKMGEKPPENNNSMEEEPMGDSTKQPNAAPNVPGLTQQDVTNARAEERDRILALIGVANVQMSDVVMESIKNGSTKEQYCVARVEADNKVQTPAPNAMAIGNIAPAAPPKDTLPSNPKAQAKKLDNHAEAICDAYLKKEGWIK